jgi:phage tail protein X
MWDSICYKALGDERYMDVLMALNLAYKDTFIFPAGVVLTLPDVETRVLDTLPPRKRVRG